MTDPISFPLEIVDLIFENVSFISLVRCMQVSRSWKSYVESNSRLWRNCLDFFEIRNAVDLEILVQCMDLCKASDEEGKRIKLLNINKVEREDLLLRYIFANHTLFEALNFTSYSTHLAANLVTFDPNHDKLPDLIDLFPNLSKLTITTGLNFTYVTVLLNLIPSLKELKYKYLADQSMNSNLSSQALQILDHRAIQSDMLNIKAGQVYGLERFYYNVISVFMSVDKDLGRFRLLLSHVVESCPELLYAQILVNGEDGRSERAEKAVVDQLRQ